jgi:hypothetical protein
MALFSFGRHVWNAGASRSEPPGLTVRSEIRTVYAPKRIIDFARAHPAIATNDELVRLVREARLEAWFGVVFRCYPGNGDVVTSRLRSDRERTPRTSRTRGACCASWPGTPPDRRPRIERTSRSR